MNVSRKPLLAIIALVAIGAVVLAIGANLVGADDLETQRQKALEESRRKNPPVTPPAEMLNAPRILITITPPTPSQPLRPRVSGPCKNDPELFAYIAQRKEALKQAKPFGPKGTFPATMNFTRPVSEDVLKRLVQDYQIYPANLNYVTNGDMHGSFCYQCDTLAGTQARLRTQYDPRYVVEGYSSMEAAATPQDLQRLNDNGNVLLVDPGTLEEYAPGKYRAKFPEPIFWRYERACH